MSERNQRIFRRILIVLGIICVFLLGSVVNISVSTRLFGFLAALTIGLAVGYRLGTGKDLRFWKNKDRKDDKDKK